jgi:hypothetical protein
MMGFANYKKCDRCGESFMGGPGVYKCEACRTRAAQRKMWAQKRERMARGRMRNAPTPLQEAYALGDPGLVAQALRGELD